MVKLEGAEEREFEGRINPARQAAKKPSIILELYRAAGAAGKAQKDSCFIKYTLGHSSYFLNHSVLVCVETSLLYEDKNGIKCFFHF